MLDRSTRIWLLLVAVVITGGCASPPPTVVHTTTAPSATTTPRGTVFQSLVLDSQATEIAPWVFQRNDRSLGRPAPATVLDEVAVIDSRQRLWITSNGRPFENTSIRIRSRQYRRR